MFHTSTTTTVFPRTPTDAMLLMLMMMMMMMVVVVIIFIIIKLEAIANSRTLVWYSVSEVTTLWRYRNAYMSFRTRH